MPGRDVHHLFVDRDSSQDRSLAFLIGFSLLNDEKDRKCTDIHFFAWVIGFTPYIFSKNNRFVLLAEIIGATICDMFCVIVRLDYNTLYISYLQRKHNPNIYQSQVFPQESERGVETIFGRGKNPLNSGKVTFCRSLSRGGYV